MELEKQHINGQQVHNFDILNLQLFIDLWAEKKYPKARFDIRKQATLAYQRSVNAHGNVLMNLVANKRSKEDVESKPKSQEHSNCQPLPINFNKVSNFHLKIKNPPKKLHSEWSLPEVDGRSK